MVISRAMKDRSTELGVGVRLATTHALFLFYLACRHPKSICIFDEARNILHSPSGQLGPCIRWPYRSLAKQKEHRAMTVKTRYLIAILVAIAVAFLGTVSIVRIDLGGKLVEAVKTAIPKLRVVHAGGCDYLYDRDDGKLVATKCASDPSAYQETIDKLKGQLDAANSQLQKSKQGVESAKARVAELEKELITQADVKSRELSTCKTKLDALTALPQCGKDPKRGPFCCKPGYYAGTTDEGKGWCYKRP